MSEFPNYDVFLNIFEHVDCLIFANYYSVDADAMLHYAAFHLGLHWFTKVPVRKKVKFCYHANVLC